MRCLFANVSRIQAALSKALKKLKACSKNQSLTKVLHFNVEGNKLCLNSVLIYNSLYMVYFFFQRFKFMINVKYFNFFFLFSRTRLFKIIKF